MIRSFAAFLLLSFASPVFQTPPTTLAQTLGKPTTDKSRQEKAKLYIIRVIDTASRKPIPKTKITVEIENDPKSKWAGLTDSNGFFQFTPQAAKQNIRAHTSVEARGYASLDDYSLLIEDRLIELHKTQ